MPLQTPQHHPNGVVEKKKNSTSHDQQDCHDGGHGNFRLACGMYLENKSTDNPVSNPIVHAASILWRSLA